jgi:hypothetical protein
MNKITGSIGQLVSKNVLTERQDAAQHFVGAQARSANWMTLPGSNPVGFMKLRSCMCRWPIGDPQQFETFKFCGADCETGDSYCDAHKKMAFAPSKASRNMPLGRLAPATAAQPKPAPVEAQSED